MKKGMIALLSVLALALAFTGCSESDGSYNASSADTTTSSTTDTTVTGDDVEATTYTNEFGIDSSLGTPPALPSS